MSVHHKGDWATLKTKYQYVMHTHINIGVARSAGIDKLAAGSEVNLYKINVMNSYT